jgi:TonB family protein
MLSARWFTHCALLVFAVGSASPAHAQAVNVPPGQWVIDYGDTRCALARRAGGAGSLILILDTYLGGAQPQLILLAEDPDNLPRRTPATVTITLSPSNHSVRASISERRLRRGSTLIMPDLGNDFAEQFGRSDRISINSGDRTIFDLALPNAGEGVTALNACNDDLLRHWGINPSERLALQRLPTADTSVGWITSTDYPPGAFGRGEQGTTVLRIAVRPDGRAAECTVVSSSGSTDLDAQSCQLTLQRGRFIPALDANGRATAASMIYRIVWRLP